MQLDQQAQMEQSVSMDLRERLVAQDQQGRQVILEAMVRLERRGLLDKQGQLVLREAREQQAQVHRR